MNSEKKNSCWRQKKKGWSSNRKPWLSHLPLQGLWHLIQLLIRLEWTRWLSFLDIVLCQCIIIYHHHPVIHPRIMSSGLLLLNSNSSSKMTSSTSRIMFWNFGMSCTCICKIMAFQVHCFVSYLSCIQESFKFSFEPRLVDVVDN